MKKLLFIFFSFSIIFSTNAQLLGNKKEYTKADTLRGSLRPERTNFDMLKYDLTVKVNPTKKSIQGVNKIQFKTLKKTDRMQLDLFENMQIDSIIYHQKHLNFAREFNAVFITFPKELSAKDRDSLSFYYSGKPVIAKNPPWDGGFIFTKDDNGKDWVSVAVQGTGASLWYPNKDHQSDEPEEAEIHIIAPSELMGVSNGRFTGKTKIDDNYTQWNWKVVNPINNYNIILNVGDYVHFSDKYKDLELHYYVLFGHKEKAEKQFQQVIPMMDCFYEKFGPYPFKEDTYKLVETPFLGMEHQSAVAYGNHFSNGYLGNDLSGTGIGLKWDFIIIHESGHEWFGNSITASDIADMWIHESFTAYAEAVYIECRWGKEDARKYISGTRRSVANRTSIIGDYGVNSEGSGDMYYKGANMLHTIRTVLQNDELWWRLLKEFSLTYKHKIIDTETVIDFFETRTKEELTPIFNQYLRYAELPKLVFKTEKNSIFYKWETSAENFNMPIDIFISGEKRRIFPTSTWKKLEKAQNLENIQVDLNNFYIEVEK
ncbi:M1 family metallopeptidase [Mesonia maritima]|uniref:Aminopeptidase N n=1 Tax=Mesonia maritima TaxID=1793873 RepID=A0ABU1K5M0_9FLAO|nr:M1 family metallopeptidase [Mesonia maritima]MDR6300907.1 aminopeptidase N [Mesonia maritima]